MIDLVILSLIAFSAVEVQVQPLSGAEVQGQLTALNEQGLTLQTAMGTLSFPTKQLATVQPSTASGDLSAAMTETEILVTLVDDSTLAAEQYRVQGSRAVVELSGGDQVTLPTRVIRSVRFNKQGETLRQQWNEILENPSSEDVIVIRKMTQASLEENEQIEVGLDQLEGLLFDIDEASVGFEFDGTRVDVPRKKVEGVIYYRPVADNTPDPVCRVLDVDGSTWNAKTVRLEEGNLQVVSAAGVAFRLPLERLAKLDFSAGNLLFLTDLRPESVEWRPYVRSSTTPASLSEWFRPKWDNVADGGPLTVGGQSYARGLSLHSRTQITYRLTRPYQRFLATVGIDDRFRGVGNVRLEISSEKGTLFERTISGDDEPIGLDIDVAGVRRLRILVDFGEDRSDSGDYLNLCNARFTK